MLLSTYDRTGKKLTQSVQADNQATATNSYDYDYLNRLKTKKYGDLAETTAYTLQGWVSSINSDKFGQSLSFAPNGNISSVNWTQSGKPAASYAVTYDAQNRLVSAIGNGYDEKGISYDRNGNILSLQRTANSAIKDDIAYQYNGNQLSTVTGNLASTYTYDNNGNLKTDSRKSLNFDYNYLNLLESAGETNYTYAADGTKLSVKNGANGFDYLGSLILSANSTEFQFSDGIITKTTGGYDVTYHLRDYLGSVRTVVNKTGDVLQQSDYYPFGLKQERADYVNNSNRFLFNGKESQTTGNLGLLDYGARMYDGEIGRWFVMDNLLEKRYGITPYNFVRNNPFIIIDPDGNDDYRLNQDGTIVLIHKTDSDKDKIMATTQLTFGKGDNKITITVIDPENAIEIDKDILDSKQSEKDLKVDGQEEKFTVTIYQGKDDEMKSLFEFAVSNSNVEWSQVKVGSSDTSVVGTSNKEKATVVSSYLFNRGYTIRESTHSHPSGYKKSLSPSKGDLNNAAIIKSKYPNTLFYIYSNKTYVKY